jgi:hypothetical protein
LVQDVRTGHIKNSFLPIGPRGWKGEQNKHQELRCAKFS